MKVRWSPEAAADLTSITQYIQRENAAAALRVARIIYRSAAELDKFPLRGRSGRVNGTRELVISPLPYIVVYRIRENFIEIAKVLHGAQRWQ
ncbi:MAG TPA: type II toxin-antitoxin system RelE/ParE family toxin [Candidatus Angelobacter sp.]|nr:type II toxin-antitoxin system RelE/ParE family toxin [Candidatus Angelobacter sp.]